MSSEVIASIITALITAVGATLVTGVLGRPKMKAEATEILANTAVGLSKNAAEAAATAELRAERAHARAEAAEETARVVNDRCDALQETINQLVRYVDILHDHWGSEEIPDAPEELLPALHAQREAGKAAARHAGRLS